jgi:hypothetical protein
MLSNANFQVNGNAAIDGNSTFGDAASDSVTFNAGTATTVGGLNYNTSTMFITNGGVSFGTNLIATTEAVRIQGAGVSGVALTVVQSPGGGAVGMQVWKTANGTTVMQVSSNGNLLVGNGALSATGYNGLNSGGTVSFINNTASTGSSTDVGGGTGTSAKTTISASGAKLGSFSTNVIQLNAVNFQATTNSSTVGPNLMATVNLIPGSIGTNSFYSTNFPVTGSITNGAYMKIVPGGGALDQYLLVDVSCKTNGTITLYINNRDPNIAHTPSNGTYGVFGVMPSL